MIKTENSKIYKILNNNNNKYIKLKARKTFLLSIKSCFESVFLICLLVI